MRVFLFVYPHFVVCLFVCVFLTISRTYQGQNFNEVDNNSQTNEVDNNSQTNKGNNMQRLKDLKVSSVSLLI